MSPGVSQPTSFYLPSLGLNLYISYSAVCKKLHYMCPSGAGKTTTFSMLTGDISPTSGTAIISGYDIRTDLRKVIITLRAYIGTVSAGGTAI